ncbi:auxin-responsive protein IAA33-like [Juglans microcarpa x Juglans regia]|uniref:auxin-responsive protein IAA33-like n=1 Tax=Juglans microcarpa x Juglans regia TaxID=2249226 RepID=UPI001B7F115D|nr:auxin-responsive protein IAA33-like [Juglans microcarpa x Juglans regia]
MNSFDSQRRQLRSLLERRYMARKEHCQCNSNWPLLEPASSRKTLKTISTYAFPGVDDNLVSTLVPPVTSVFQGRSICQRVNLHKHASYHSLAKALRQMFVDAGDVGLTSENDQLHDLSNAIPCHLTTAYEDIENDLLLAGDLNWKSFVRVAKRIRILPMKSNSRP